MIKMSAASVLTNVIKSTPHLARMTLSLSWTYLTLGRQVRKARKAFEKQLISQGMTREDAKRLSACFEELKNSLVGMLKQGITRSL
jgi:hypothetical protein